MNFLILESSIIPTKYRLNTLKLKDHNDTYQKELKVSYIGCGSSSEKSRKIFAP